MEQHPVPQHIASFEFKLFGNLTVRQFVTLAIPLTLAGIVYFSTIAPIVRIPIALFLGVFGFFIALVPIQGRSFDKWIVAFIKAVLSPTQRIWVKEKVLPRFLQVATLTPKTEQQAPQEIGEQSKQRLMAYLKSLPSREAKSPLDMQEDMELGKLDAKLASNEATSRSVVWPGVNSGLRLSGLEAGAQAFLAEPAPVPKTGPFVDSHIEQKVIVKPAAKPYIIAGVEEKLPKLQHPKTQRPARRPVTHLASDSNFAQGVVIPIKTPGNRLRLLAGVGQTRVRRLHFGPPEGFDLSKLPVRGEKVFQISDELKRRFHIESELELTSMFEQDKRLSAKEQKEGETEKKVPVVKSKIPKMSATMPGTLPVQAAPEQKFASYELNQTNIKQPSNISQTSGASVQHIMQLTDQPNVIYGLITDSMGRPAEGTIVIVRDEKGVPLRAFKTNKIGHFLSVTSLPNGKYTIEAENQSMQFAPRSIQLKGEVLAPLLISA